MEYSEKFNFQLPSRSNSDDMADIDVISNNFRKIDDQIPSTVQVEAEINSLKGLVALNKANLELQIQTSSDSLNYTIEKNLVELRETKEDLQNQITDTEKNLESQGEFIHQSLAPVIRKTARGTTVAITDISPIEHTVKVKALGNTNLLMYSKNMFNPRYNGNFIEMINKIVAVHNQAYILSVSKPFGNVLMSAVLEDGSTREWLAIGMDMTNLAFKIDGDKVYSGVNFDIVIDFEKHIEKFSLRVSSADLMNWDDTTKVQLEYGTTPTEYEPSVEHVYSFPAGVTYLKIPSVYPVTLLMSQTEGVELEVEYNVDTKKYIDEKNKKELDTTIQEIEKQIEETNERITNTNERITNTKNDLSNQILEIEDDARTAKEIAFSVVEQIFNTAPAITNTKSGTAIAITDISPIEHTLEVKARSENLFDITKANVIKIGSNILPYPYMIFSKEDIRALAGITYTNNKDGGIHIKGTATDNGLFTLGDIDLGNSYIDASSGVDSKTNGVYTISKFLVYDHTTKRIKIGVKKGLTVDEVVYPQVNYGDKLLPYEPYTETPYSIATDGTVEGITSLYPATILKADTEGVVLDVKYKADTKKYIDNKIAEAVALALEV